MHNEDIFLGDIGVVPTTTSRTSIPTQAPGYDGSGINPDLPVKEVIIEEEEEDTSSNNWIMYLGVGIMAYVLLFRKK